MGAGRPIAFFDVDETLIATKSIFGFLRSWLAARGDDGSAYRAQRQRLRALAEAGADRTVVNSAYYELYAGCSWSALIEHGRAWFDEFVSRPEPFVAGGLAALARHRAAGHLIVLVSGSFDPCLRPVAELFGADLVLGTRLVVCDDGRLDGRIKRAMIGVHKGTAVRELMAASGADPARCHAYGDHSSDLPLLEAVGHPAVVGDDPVLRAEAERNGWPLLSGARTRMELA